MWTETVIWPDVICVCGWGWWCVQIQLTLMMVDVSAGVLLFYRGVNNTAASPSGGAFRRSQTGLLLSENTCAILLLRHFYETVERMTEWYLERREMCSFFSPRFRFFSLNRCQHWGHALCSSSHLPPPSTRTCFHGLLVNVALLCRTSSQLLPIPISFDVNGLQRLHIMTSLNAIKQHLMEND